MMKQSNTQKKLQKNKKGYTDYVQQVNDAFHCDGTKDCKILKNGENKGCQKCAKEHRQLEEWLKELKWLREQTRWIPCEDCERGVINGEIQRP